MPILANGFATIAGIFDADGQELTRTVVVGDSSGFTVRKSCQTISFVYSVWQNSVIPRRVRAKTACVSRCLRIARMTVRVMSSITNSLILALTELLRFGKSVSGILQMARPSAASADTPIESLAVSDPCLLTPRRRSHIPGCGGFLRSGGRSVDRPPCMSLDHERNSGGCRLHVGAGIEPDDLTHGNSTFRCGIGTEVEEGHLACVGMVFLAEDDRTCSTHR